MAMTAKEIIGKVTTTEINAGLVSTRSDAVELLSEGKQFDTTIETHKRIIGQDGNVVSTVNANGTVTLDADLAMLQDRAYTIESWEFPDEERIRVSIPHQKLYQYGIDNASLNKLAVTAADGVEVNAVVDGISAEIQKMTRKVRMFRRNQVKHLLSTLEAPTLEWQKTMGGYANVALKAARPNFFAYTNLLANATLTTDAFDEALDILSADQKNMDNDDFGLGDFQAGLHATRKSLMMRQVDPSGISNVNERSFADAINGGDKFVGTYDDQTAGNSGDWIVLGFGHSIRRLNFGGPGMTNGMKVEIHELGSAGQGEVAGTSGKNAYGIEIVCFIRSIMVVDSPIGIVKNVVA